MKLLLFFAAFISARLGGHGERRDFANIAQGIHANGVISREAENPFTLRYLLAKQGTADNQIDLCDADERPLGICEDEPAIGNVARVALCGASNGTRLMVASGVITAGDTILTDASGKVQAETGAASGNYYRVGTCITPAAADGDEFEVAPQTPEAVVVA